MAHLADLYAIGVIGAVAVNLGTCSTNRALSMRWWERTGMMALAALMIVIWITVAWEKPWALAFAVGIMATGLGARWVAHNRGRIRDWMLAPVPTPLPIPEEPNPLVVRSVVLPLVEEQEVPTTQPVYTPQARIVVATRHNPKLIRFALEQARTRQGELLVLFVRHIAVTTMGSANVPDASTDWEAQAMFDESKRMADRVGVPMAALYAVSSDVADAILDLAVTHGADVLILGVTKRGMLWRTMQGDVIQQVVQYLPERTNLLIHA